MSALTVAGVIVGTVQTYLAIGLLFALPFVLFLIGRVDPSAKGGTWGFRILVIPGVSLLWPLLLMRLVRGRTTPVECNAHRRCAASRAINKPEYTP